MADRKDCLAGKDRGRFEGAIVRMEKVRILNVPKWSLRPESCAAENLTIKITSLPHSTRALKTSCHISRDVVICADARDWQVNGSIIESWLNVMV